MTPLVAVVTRLTVLSTHSTTLGRQAPERPQSTARPPASPAMTNADVIEMIRAGLSDNVIIGSIRQAKARKFDTSPTSLIELKQAGAGHGSGRTRLGRRCSASEVRA